jgi:glutamate synthase (NADPH/NADH) small chain
MADEGITFKCGVDVGKDVKTADLVKDFDAVVLSGGARQPRDLPIPGRQLKGIHYAGDFLRQSNKRVSGEKYTEADILATGKNVVVIGGGDTGSDCVGTSNRHNAKHVYQIEVMPQPPACRDDGACAWPFYPLLMKTTSSHEEGVVREWCILTKEFVGDADGNVKKLNCVRVEFVKENGKQVMKEIAGSEFTVDADLVLLAVGFVAPVHAGLLDDLGVAYDSRGNVQTDANMNTSVKKVFAAGDMRTGQSLVMKCIAEGRKTAHFVDTFLMGRSDLPSV